VSHKHSGKNGKGIVSQTILWKALGILYKKHTFRLGSQMGYDFFGNRARSLYKVLEPYRLGRGRTHNVYVNIHKYVYMS